MEFDQPVSASIDAGSPVQLFVFEGAAGDEVTVTLASEDDAYHLGMDIFADASQQRVMSLNSPIAGTAIHTVTLPDDGLYTVYVFDGSFTDPTDEAAFSISVTEAD